MILVDTSALVPYLKGKNTSASDYLHAVLAREIDILFPPEVVQEVLQGARDPMEWRSLMDYLLTQEMALPRDPLLAHVEAARIYFDCRRRGITIRSSVDCLIAQRALEHDLALLHQDRDFDAIRRVRPLKTLP
jgi:hypothetical protein